MQSLRILAALSVAVLVGACASPGSMNAASPSATAAPMAMGASGPMAAQDFRIKAQKRSGVSCLHRLCPAWQRQRCQLHEV